eukprot:9811255-Alexandrium_andersonii.AAC.1
MMPRLVCGDVRSTRRDLALLLCVRAPEPIAIDVGVFACGCGGAPGGTVQEEYLGNAGATVTQAGAIVRPS